MINKINKILIGAILCAIPSFVFASDIIQKDKTTFTNDVYFGTKITVGSTNQSVNSNSVAFKVVGDIEAEQIIVGGNSNPVSPLYITNGAVNGYVLFSSVDGGITNYYWGLPITNDMTGIAWLANANVFSGGTNTFMGRVGIGTNAPTAELVVVDADATAGQVILYGGATSPGLSLHHQLSGAARRNWGLRTEQNIQGDFSILESASSSASPSVTRLTILSGGNVGIGTSSPSNKLEVAGTFQATKMTNTIIDESCTFQGSSYTPYPVISSYSNGILLVNGNYQKIVCTNNVGTNYFDIPVTNKSAFLLLEVDKGTNSLSFYTDNLTTNGLGSINSITLTNSGITSIQFYFPCAGTNLGLKWKAYQF